MTPVFTFRDVPAVMVRTPLWPAREEGSGLSPTGGVLSEAMFLASRQASARPGAGDAGRAGLTLRAYDLRSRWRATPHGAFAGVATARVAGHGEAAGLGLGAAHRARTNPAGLWLAGLADLLLADPAVMQRLRLTVNNLVIHRGSLLECEWRTRRVTVRATEPALLVLSLCAGGATATHITGEVTRRWPVTEPAVLALLIQLVRGGFLLTDILPTDINTAPLGHVLDRLPREHTLTGPVTQLRQLLADADRHPVGAAARLTALASARELADAICHVERPLAIDVAADSRVVVPRSVPDEAARAASALWQAGAGTPELQDWHTRFAERYGPDRLVPLLEATDPATGLGIEDTRDAGTGEPSDRTRVLAGLLARAAAANRTEVVLDEATLAELSRFSSGDPPRTTELGVRLIAAGRRDLEAGRLQLAVVPPDPGDAGSAIGRFTGLLAGIRPVRPAGEGEPITAEIVTQVRVPEGAGLAPPTGLSRWRIPVGVPAHDGDIELADLHLASDGQRLWCWSARYARPVIPVLHSRLAPYLLPPLARFLQRVGGAGCRAPHLWSWGELAYAPFQPRVRYRDTILAPARWVLPPCLTGAASSRTAWGDALDAWRATMTPAPPQVVITDDGDQRLPLDLSRDDDRELLRRYARRGLAAVCEPPGGPESVQAVADSPSGRHIIELVIPLQARTPARSAPSRTRLALPRKAGDEGLLLPGGPWLSLTVRAPAACHDQILIRLAGLGRELAGHVDLWFWLRYNDAAHGPHLRIRFHGDPAVLGGTVLPAFSAWAAELIRQQLSGGFSVEPYDQEIERYGGPDMPIRLAEHFFAADSRLALDVLTATSDPDQRLAAAAVSAAAIAATIADGAPDALGHHRLDRVARRRFEALRPRVRAAGPLRDPATRPDSITAGLSAEAWTARQEALTAYRNVVKPDWRAECGSSLIHMHANRLLGDASLETVARALAADLLALPAGRDKP